MPVCALWRIIHRRRTSKSSTRRDAWCWHQQWCDQLASPLVYFRHCKSFWLSASRLLARQMCTFDTCWWSRRDTALDCSLTRLNKNISQKHIDAWILDIQQLFWDLVSNMDPPKPTHICVDKLYHDISSCYRVIIITIFNAFKSLDSVTCLCLTLRSHSFIAPQGCSIFWKLLM